MDVQRAGLIDLNIRGLCKRFIEVLKMDHEKTETGRIVKTMFQCREFPDWLSVDQYLSSGAQTYKETQYENKGQQEPRRRLCAFGGEGLQLPAVRGQGR